MMETLEELLRKHSGNGKLQVKTAQKIAITMNALHKNGGHVEQASGLASRLLWDQVKDDIDMGVQSFGGAHLRRMEEMGLINVTRNGKRTFIIEAAAYPPDIEHWLPESVGVLNTLLRKEAEASVALDGETQSIPDEDSDEYKAQFEADVLGARPGRLAARIEKSIPEIVQLAVTQAVDNKIDQILGGLGFVKEAPAVPDGYLLTPMTGLLPLLNRPLRNCV